MTSTPQWTTESLLNKLEAFNQLYIVVGNQADREQLHHLNDDYAVTMDCCENKYRE